jgi:hypothetical protein
MVAAAGAAVDKAGQVLPGGSLRLAAASARSVSLDETFDPPLMLGYLGFDCVLYKGGILGPPIPTHAVLNTNYNLGSLLAISPTYEQMLNVALYGIISADTSSAARAIGKELDALEAYAPDQFTTYNPTRSNPTNFLLTASILAKGALGGFRAFQQFQSSLQDSIKALHDALAQPSFQLKLEGQAQEETVSADCLQREKLRQKLAYYETWFQRNVDDSKTQKATSDAYGYLFEHLAR